MPDPNRPVFLDPSGRRHRVIRVLAISGVIAIACYLVLVLVAAFGGPLAPTARLPLLPDSSDGAANAPVDPVPVTGTTAPPDTGNTTTTGQPVASGTSQPAPATITTTRGRRTPVRPTDPPGNGDPPTTPPRNGG